MNTYGIPFDLFNSETSNPASAAQHKFIASLLVERGVPADSLWAKRIADLYRKGDVDGRKAHQIIDALLDKPKADSKPAETPKPGEHPMVARARRSSEPVEGFHLYKGGVFKVLRAVHGSGRLYAKELNFVTKGFRVAPGMTKHLTEDTLMSREQAEELGKLYGVCIRCGRTLTDEVSIARGMGEICAGKW